jgi:radical SAM superfamily enzyme YgiQ (UPF0313 family)
MKKISFNSIVPLTISKTSHMLVFHHLNSYLKQRGIAHYFDRTFNLFFTEKTGEEIAEAIRKQGADVITFSAQIWNISKIREVCRLLKTQKPDVFILMGGVYAEFLADTLITDGLADCIVKGAGEAVFYRLMDKIRSHDNDFSTIPNLIYRDGDKLITTETDHDFDVSAQDYVLSYEVGPFDIIGYEASRGCPNRCRFCSWSAAQKEGKIRYYPVAKIERDMETIFNIHEVVRLFFCDSDLFLNRKHGLSVLRCIHKFNGMRKSRGWPEVFINFEINPESIDEDIIEALSMLSPETFLMGCGLQTIDEHVNNQHLNRRFHRERYIRNLRLLEARLGKNIMVEIICGLPGETYAGFKRTVEFLLSEVKQSMFACSRFRVLPASYFWDHAGDYNLVYQKDPPHFLLFSDTFSKEDMDKANRLVFFIHLFFTILKGVKRMVEKNVFNNQLSVYEKIIDHISGRYPEFVSYFYNLAEAEEDVAECVYRTVKDPSIYKELGELRYDIIRDAREIVRSHCKGL